MQGSVVKQRMQNTRERGGKKVDACFVYLLETVVHQLAESLRGGQTDAHDEQGGANDAHRVDCARPPRHARRWRRQKKKKKEKLYKMFFPPTPKKKFFLQIKKPGKSFWRFCNSS